MKQVLQEGPNYRPITKSISDGLYLFDHAESNTSYLTYTEKVQKDITEHHPSQISPSLLQENIKKKYELRVFFLEDTCYPMAIFSQLDTRTKIDIRKYNEKKPNRFVPYKLPANVKENIIKLFKKLNLNTGSVDLLVDQQEQIFFLEINSVGQFNMVSWPCNYYLEKQIATC